MERDPTDCFHVMEVANAIDRNDAGLGALEAQFGDAFVEARVIGGYARPLVLPRITAKK